MRVSFAVAGHIWASVRENPHTVLSCDADRETQFKILHITEGAGFVSVIPKSIKRQFRNIRTYSHILEICKDTKFCRREK